MDISREEARESLSQIEDAVQRTKKMFACGGVDTLFIVWGLIWVLGFVSDHFLPLIHLRLGQHIVSISWPWLILVATGITMTLIVWQRHAPVKEIGDRRIGRRIFWFWGLLFLYAWMWIGLLFPFVNVRSAEQSQMLNRHLSAIAATIPMFAYVVIGLWLAVTGGGMLIGTGVVIRNRWR